MNAAWTLETKGAHKKCSGHCMVEWFASGEEKRERARGRK
jgi:hypothetical protein